MFSIKKERVEKMKKKNDGFTLIELLAIIVILAIIAVITVPIILNVIDNAKRGTAQDSAYGYKDAISKYYVTEFFNNNNITLNGDYTVDSNGVLSNDTERHEILFSGTKPQGGHLTYLNNVLTNGCLTIDDYKVVFSDGETTNVEKGTCDSVEETPQVTYKCKRADVSTLHTEECTQTSGSCYAAGYTTDNKGTTITYGNQEVTQGTLTSGDAFDCDVNGDRTYDPVTERFYYVSDLSTNSEYAVLVYSNNTTSGVADNTSSSLIAYDSSNINYQGPVTGIANLPTTTQWSNISLSNTNRAITTETGTTSTNGGTLPTAFSYEGYAARLLTAQEINTACGITVGSAITGELDTCNYLIENTRYSNGSLGSNGYWLETPYASNSSDVWGVYGDSRSVYYYYAFYTGGRGVRPAIEILKSEIQY